MKIKQEDVAFGVSLDSIALTDIQRENIERGIKEVVMRELARVDNRGDIVINQKLELNPKFEDLFDGVRTAGIWVEDLERFKARQVRILK